MSEGTLALALLVSGLLGMQSPATCVSADECRRLTLEAIDARQYERAHDLAWLAYQKGARQDPITLTLLARAQSLSGRADDAFVMLRRLSEAGISVDDVHTSDDFARVRTHPGWPVLQASFERLASSRKDAAIDGTATVANVAAAPAASNNSLPAGKRSAAPPAEGASSTAVGADRDALNAFTPTPVEAKRANEDLTLPALAFSPAAVAYDEVSARFVLSAPASDALTVVSQTSTNAASFTSRGWSGHDRITALAIDRRAGDLWVAVNSASGAMLHRLQLISGRRLDALEIPGDQPADINALAAGTDGVFALDRAARRVLRRTPQSKALSSFVRLPPELIPTALAYAPRALYVAHGDGLLRVELASRRQQPVAASHHAAVANLHSLAWHDGVLLAIQRSAEKQQVVRLHLNAAGTRITRVDALGGATSDVATLSGGVYHFLADEGNGVRVMRSVLAK
jgi:hypothetical protein